MPPVMIALVGLAAVAVAASDTTPPKSVMTAERPPDHNGWYRTDVVKLTLKVTDEGSGIESVEASDETGRGPFWSPFFFSPAKPYWTTTIDLCCGDIHRITYRARDAAGNVEPMHELIIRNDARPPVVDLNPSYTGPSDYYTWTSGNWQVYFTCDDPTYNSGLVSSGCAGDSYLKIDGAVRNAEAVQAVTAEGRHWALGREHDVAGNMSQVTVALNIDRRAPRPLVLNRRITLRGPDGVQLIGSAHDPLLADGTPGSGTVSATFRVTNPETGEFVAWAPATGAGGEIWTSTVDLRPGRYAVELWAEDRPRNQGYSERVIITVLDVDVISAPPLPIEELHEIIDRVIGSLRPNQIATARAIAAAWRRPS